MCFSREINTTTFCENMWCPDIVSAHPDKGKVPDFVEILFGKVYFRDDERMRQLSQIHIYRNQQQLEQPASSSSSSYYNFSANNHSAITAKLAKNKHYSLLRVFSHQQHYANINELSNVSLYCAKRRKRLTTYIPAASTLYQKTLFPHSTFRSVKELLLIQLSDFFSGHTVKKL
jgi:hypothetical protein